MQHKALKEIQLYLKKYVVLQKLLASAMGMLRLQQKQNKNKQTNRQTYRYYKGKNPINQELHCLLKIRANF